MEPANWLPSHCEALKDCLTRGMSYRGAAEAINARFGTAYSRSAALGRARRMGLPEPRVPKPPPAMTEERLRQVRGSQTSEFGLSASIQPRPVFQRLEQPVLRCVEIEPRHLELIELEEGDCRYPYGGDAEGEAITFCGRPRRGGSSYCTPHFHLTRSPDIPAEQAPSIVPLRLVEEI